MKKGLIYIAIALALLVSLVLPAVAQAATSDTSTGSFSAANKAPVINSITLRDLDDSTDVTTMTPYTEYLIKVNVTDLNKLKQLNTVVVTAYYDSDGSGAPVPTTGNTQSAAILTCTVGGSNGTWSITGGTGSCTGTIETSTSSTTVTGHGGTLFTSELVVGSTLRKVDDTYIGTVATITDNDTLTLTANAASTNTDPGIAFEKADTWSIDTTGTPGTDACYQPTLSGYTGDFEFYFTPGKVATSGTGKWFISVTVTDQHSDSDTDQTTAKNMSTYGEVDVITTTVDFGAIDQDTGTGFTDDLYEESPISVTYISNSAYTQRIMGTNWYDSTADDTLSAQANSAQKNVVVNSATGFAVGQTVFIQDDDNPDLKESNTIDSIAGTTLTMTTNLANTYTADATIKHAAIFTGTATTDNANEFALKANVDSDDLEDGDTATVTTDGAQIDTGTQTSEAGNPETANALWLKVAMAFDAATYSGTITYIIVN